jgi:hypothetical protein
MAILSKPVGIVVAAAVGIAAGAAFGQSTPIVARPGGARPKGAAGLRGGALRQRARDPASAPRSHRTALRTYNHKLSRLFRLAAPAANLQQNLSYWLQPEPGAATGVGHVGAARPRPPCYESQTSVSHNRQLLHNRHHRNYPRNYPRNYRHHNCLPSKSAADETRALLLGGFDRPHKGVDHPRDCLCLARRDLALGERRGDRVHRQRDVAGRQPAALSRERALDRRQTGLHGALPARRQHASHAEPHCGRVAGERQLDGLARQRLRLAREKCRGGKCRLVAGTPSPAARVARSALFEGPPEHPRRRLR